jgi:Na+-driven multidrug efflux pump
MTFTGQNYGAGKADRIKKVLIYSVIQTVLVGILVGQTELLFGRQLAGLYVSRDDPNALVVVDTAMEVITLLLTTYFIAGIMDCMSGALRGMGYSVIPMLVSLSSICGVRTLWVFFIFPIEKMHTIRGLLLSYPVTWSLASVIFISLAIYAYRKIKKTLSSASAEAFVKSEKETGCENEVKV